MYRVPDLSPHLHGDVAVEAHKLADGRDKEHWPLVAEDRNLEQLAPSRLGCWIDKVFIEYLLLFVSSECLVHSMEYQEANDAGGGPVANAK